MAAAASSHPHCSKGKGRRLAGGLSLSWLEQMRCNHATAGSCASLHPTPSATTASYPKAHLSWQTLRDLRLLPFAPTPNPALQWAW